MLAQMYSLWELDRGIRKTFELPEDPYSNDKELQEKGQKYLRELGIFFFRDEENARGLVLQPKHAVDVNIDVGFIGYKQLVELDEDDFSVLPWDEPTAKKIAEEGDDRAWLIFNEQRLIHMVTDEAIRTG